MYYGAALGGDNHLIDFASRETGDLDRRVGQDHFLEFDLELVEIPLALLAEPIDREPQQTLLLIREMSTE